jgi:hypothetical protein
VEGVGFGGFVQGFLWFLASYRSFVTSAGIFFYQHIGEVVTPFFIFSLTYDCDPYALGTNPFISDTEPSYF